MSPVCRRKSQTVPCPACTSIDVLGHVLTCGDLKNSSGTIKKIGSAHKVTPGNAAHSPADGVVNIRVMVFPAEPSNEMIIVNDGAASLHHSPVEPSAHRSGKRQPLLPLTEIHFGVIEDIQTTGGRRARVRVPGLPL